ncbi:DUF2207 domain-containing protein [Candidatus Peregrinibacteria bacterium]|nr:DUF2207 domain-containing protein [Candidatus Peregrinibacteria bacterium]
MSKIRLLFLSLFLAVLFAVPAFAQEAFEIDEFRTEIHMHENGALTVTETIDVTFSEERHGIYRDIQTEGIAIEIISVKDAVGKNYRYDEQNIGNGVRLKIGDPDVYVNGEQEYKIAYNVRKAVRFFPDHDELYWNATGNEWPVPIHSAVTAVRLPPSVKGSENLQFKCFTGRTGSAAENCFYEYGDEVNAVVFRANQSLPAYNGLTIVVGMPPNIFERPPTLEVISDPAEADVFINGAKQCETPCVLDELSAGTYQAGVSKFGYKTPAPHTVDLSPGESVIESFDLEKYYWLDLVTWLGVLLFFALAFEPIITFFRKGRDPKGRGTIMPQYEPPDGMSPAEMGTLVDEKVHMHDLTSTIVDLCVRGYMKIKELPEKGIWIFKSKDYELIRLDKPKPGDRGLSDFEKTFIDKLFGSKTTIKISDLRNKFYTSLPILKEMLFDSLVAKGFFPKSPQKTRNKYLIKGFVVLFAGFLFQALEGVFLGTAFSMVFFWNGIFSIIFAHHMPAKSKEGTLAREHILGFKDYLLTAEKDRLKFQEKENIFYEFLPYAMTLQIADKWSKAFKDIYNQPPNWYEGHAGVFNTTAFVRNLGTVSGSMGSALASRPGGSGGSGFSGGSSGGGFGGGGGGSW